MATWNILPRNRDDHFIAIEGGVGFFHRVKHYLRFRRVAVLIFVEADLEKFFSPQPIG